MRFSPLLLSLLGVTPSLSSNDQFAEIFIANTYHMRGNPCTGGNIVSIESITRSTEIEDIKERLNLKKFPPGSYSFKFRYNTQISHNGVCSEQGNETQLLETNLQIKPGKHYEISLTNSLDLKVDELDDRRIDMHDASGLGILTNNRSIMTSSCIDLFPGNKSKYINWYKASSFSRYADVFGYELIEGNFLSKERVETILAANSVEVKAWCDQENIASIKHFDFLYGPYVEDVRTFMEETLGTNKIDGRATKKIHSAPDGKTVEGFGPRTHEEIAATINKNKGILFAAYNRKLRQEPDFGGIYYFRFSINENGSVIDCGLANKGGRDINFAEKVCARISAFDFGYKKNSGTQLFEYPINFN